LFPLGCDDKGTDDVAAPDPVYEGTIVAAGNSLTEGMGVAEENAYPARLENKLQADGYRYRVINAGVSGETSSGLLSRINWILTLRPDIVILETGANDGLRGIDPRLTEKNLNQIIDALQDHDVVIVLAGMQMVQNLGREYTTAFGKIFPAVAQKQEIIFIPFFLEGVAGEKNLNQADGIHPTAKGYEIIVSAIYPKVLEAIERHRK
jgi:acyl-CoA thioesterase-1